MSAIETFGLTKDYSPGFWRKSPRRVLDGLSLRVERGEVFGFLGHNGAGKTTTIKLLIGLIFATEGRATVLDHPAGSPEALRSLGYLPENPYFYDYLTPEELLDYFARFFPFTAAERRRRCETVLAQAGLMEVRKVALRKFSKGMMQRIGIAQAILHNPEILILDEPMSGLDPVGRRELRDLILRLKEEGKTVFFSTHILSDAEALCDRVAILNRGKLAGVGQIGALLQRQSAYEAVLECSPAAPRDLLPRLQALSIKPVAVSGGHYRLELAEERTRDLLALSVQPGVHLLSLSPLRFSLEDYVVELLQGPDPETALAASASQSPASQSEVRS